MLPVLQVGPLAIQTPGLIMLLGLWLGLDLAGRLSRRLGIYEGRIDSLVLWSLIAGIIGARFGFLLRYPDAWLQRPLSAFSLSPGMLDLSGGLLAAGLAGVLYAQRNKLGLWQTLDALTPVFAVTTAASYLSQLAAGTGFGIPTSVPWAIYLWGEMRHPTQIYAFLLSVVALVQAIFFTRTNLFGSGLIFGSWLAVAALAHLFVEAFRGDSHILIGNIRTAQVAAFGLAAWSFWLINRALNRNREIQQTGEQKI